MISNNKRFDLCILNMICRICAREDANSIPIFGAAGTRQNIAKKIHACLPVVISEADPFPKKICLTCLTKLDSFWDMHNLCAEAQLKIDNIKYRSLRHKENVEQANSASDANCGSCNKEVFEHEEGVGCDGPCQKWYHRICAKINKIKYDTLSTDKNLKWFCKNCEKSTMENKISHVFIPIEEKLKGLTEDHPLSYGDSAVICLAPVKSSLTPPTPAVSVPREAHVIPMAVEPVMAPVTYLAPAPPPTTTTPAAPPHPVSEDVYPQTLIQVPQNLISEQPVIYQNRTVPPPAAAPAVEPARSLPLRRPTAKVPLPRPMTAPVPSPIPATFKRSTPVPIKRQKEAPPNGPNAKKLCVYCNKYFTDDIIDHHISLHLRQSFRTCLDCDKNFRSEDALERHRCGVREETIDSIELDDDDEEETIIL